MNQQLRYILKNWFGFVSHHAKIDLNILKRWMKYLNRQFTSPIVSVWFWLINKIKVFEYYQTIITTNTNIEIILELPIVCKTTHYR